MTEHKTDEVNFGVDMDARASGRAVIFAFYALCDELIETDVLREGAVSARIRRLRLPPGYEPVEEMLVEIANTLDERPFRNFTTADTLRVIEGGGSDEDRTP